MNNKNDHPIWDIYDEIITMNLNVYYLEWQQKILKISNFYSEFIVAITTSSAIAGFWLWQTNLGSFFWKAIGLLAAVLTILKPIINLTEKIRETTELLTSARAIHHELFTISLLVKQYDEYKEEYRQRFIKAMEYKGNFIKDYKDGNANKKMVKECFKRSVEEFPPDKFYVPKR